MNHQRPLTQGEAAAVAEHFEGDLPLYLQYASACWEQFSMDLASGDAAAEAGDLRALRLLSHNLKTVLAALGHPAPSTAAAELEMLAADGNPLTVQRWTAFAASLRHLAASLGKPLKEMPDRPEFP